jgi:molybdopterin molybdotransferase
MISVKEAIEKVHQHIESLDSSVSISTKKAGHRILAETIESPINMPPFRQSAMDGYAIHIHDDLCYRLIGEVKAGDDHHPVLTPGDAVRIFTGAPVPDTCNAVVIQEKVTVDNDHIVIQEHPLLNSNVRSMGEQVTVGEPALEKGTFLSPAAIGFLSSLGIDSVPVYNEPRIAVVITGNELIDPGTDLSYGKIFESNSSMLLSALKSMNYQQVSVHRAQDDFISTKILLKDVLLQNDLVLISGGISVGDYDFVGRALRELNVEQIFYKVNQKPGKPLFFGKTESSYVFALPGNPASALTCFYVYVYAALRKLSGNTDYQMPWMKASLRSDYVKKGSRAQFLKALVINGEAEILEGQSSAMLHTYALANALVYIGEERMSVSGGEWLDVIPLPI